jgi:Arc/MetJ family transcription regulator
LRIVCEQINEDLSQMCIMVGYKNTKDVAVNMRTNIDIDDNLMAKALELLVQVQAQEAIRNLRGKLTWQGSLSEMRADDSTPGEISTPQK